MLYLLINWRPTSATVQLSSKVTFARIWNLECAQDASETQTCPEPIRDASVQIQNIVIKLQKDLCNYYALVCQMRDASRTRPGCVCNAGRMCTNVTSELSCTVITRRHSSMFLLRKGGYFFFSVVVCWFHNNA